MIHLGKPNDDVRTGVLDSIGGQTQPALERHKSRACEVKGQLPGHISQSTLRKNHLVIYPRTHFKRPNESKGRIALTQCESGTVSSSVTGHVGCVGSNLWGRQLS
jgi:hypothetical protein